MIPESESKVIYTGDGVTKVFPFTFPYADAADVKAMLYEVATGIEKHLERDFYVDTVQGTVSYPGYPPGEEPPESEQPAILDHTQRIIIYRETEAMQPVDLGDKYPLYILEKMHDRAIMLIQELEEIMARAVIVSMGDDRTPEDIVETIMDRAEDAENAAASAATSEKNAAASAVNAEASAQAAALQAENAKASAEAAAESEEEAAAHAVKAGERIDKIAGYAASAEASVNMAAAYTTLIQNKVSRVWDTTQAYDAGEVVIYTDGYIYRCLDGSPAGEAPEGSLHWAKISLMMDNFFINDKDSYLTPSNAPSFSNAFYLDEDGYIVTKEELSNG